MDEKKEIKRIRKYLSIIQSTKLLCNTNTELGELVDYSISKGNGLTRMGGKSLFMKQSLLAGLARLVDERTGLNLETLLVAYIQADDLYRLIPKRYRNEETARNLVAYYCGTGAETSDIAAVRGKVKDQHVPLLALRLLDVLPGVNSRAGDVKDIEQDYERVLDFLRAVTAGGFHTEKLPAMVVAEHESRPGNTEKNRIHLIYITHMVLDAYKSSATRYDLSRLNMNIAEAMFDPEIEGIWTEDEESTVFWRLKPICNGYFMYRIKIKQDIHQLSYIKYHIKFYQEDDRVMAIVIRPRIINYLVKDLPIPGNMFAYLDCIITDGLITFDSMSCNEPWFGLKQLTPSRRADDFQKLIDSEDWTMVDEFPEDAYNLEITIVAITIEAIYLKTKIDEDVTDCSGPYYRIPKSLNEELLDQVGFNSIAGVLTLSDGSVFLAFDELRLYYDVSTPEKMAELGIKVVDTITA